MAAAAPAKATDTKLENARQKLAALSEYLNKKFVERSDAIEGLLIALVGRYNVFLGGPPGTAKSNLALEITRAIEGGQAFIAQIFKQSDASEVLGNFSVKKLREEDRFVRVTRGHIQEAHVALLDEIDKGTGSLLNGLLSVMNERVWYSEGQPHPIPLRLLIGTANTDITGPDLAAFMDRFQFRYWVHYIRDINNFMKMVEQAVGSSQEETETPPSITLEELEWLEKYAQLVPVTKEAVECLAELRLKLSQAERQVSDRRWVQLIKAARVKAVLSGQTEVQPHHLRIATPFLAIREDDTVVQKVVDDVVPRQAFSENVVQDLENRLAEILKIKNPSKRVEALRQLSKEVSTLVAAKADPKVLEFKIKLIHHLNTAMMIQGSGK